MIARGGSDREADPLRNVPRVTEFDPNQKVKAGSLSDRYATYKYLAYDQNH